MKTHDLKGMDQADALVLLEQLQLHCAQGRGLVHTAEGTIVAPPALTTGKDQDIFADIRTLEKHAMELESRLNGAAPVFKFTGGGAAISPPTAAARPSSNPPHMGSQAAPPNQKITLTQRVLQARGVSSMGELREKCKGQTPEQRAKAAAKLTLPVLMVAFLLLAMCAGAQSAVPWDTSGNHYLRGSTSGSTNTLAANTTDNFSDIAPWFPCNFYTNCGVSISFSTTVPVAGGSVQLVATKGMRGPGTISGGGSDLLGNFWETTPSYSVSIPLNSTNPVCFVDNINLRAANIFKLQLVNTNGVALTNEGVCLLLKCTKRGAVTSVQK